MERTEDDILSKSPIRVTLGSTQYDLQPLPIIKARKWRAQLTEAMLGIVGNLSVEQSNLTMGPSLTAALVNFPDRVADLVFAWAPELPVEQINAEATEEQLVVAFSGVMKMAYPFLAQLQTVTQIVMQSRSK